ncbi:hypothetical protein [Thiosulfatimonas sediminis]|nr:hypothetical protein [Thiosulfatimonas sediminis]
MIKKSVTPLQHTYFLVRSSIALFISAQLLYSAPALSNPYFNGFITQGLVFSDENAFLTNDSEQGSFDFREIGLNMNYIISPKWRLSGQVLSQKLGDTIPATPKVDYLLADYGFYNQGLNRAGLRFGRVKTPYGFYNDSRDLPSARPGALLPDAIYYEGLRDFMISTDGANLYSSHQLAVGSLSLDAYFGQHKTSSDASERFYLGRTIDQIEIKNFDKLGINAFFEPVSSNFQFNYSYLQIHPEVTLLSPIQFPNANNGIDTLNEINYKSDIHLFSIRYQLPKHSFMVEYSDIGNTTSTVVNDQKTTRKTYGEAYYAQWQWLPLNQMETWLRYSYYLANKDNGETSLRSYSKVATAALRWHFNADLNVTGQYDLREGDALIPIHKDYDPSTRNKHWSVFLVQMNYQFSF